MKHLTTPKHFQKTDGKTALKKEWRGWVEMGPLSTGSKALMGLGQKARNVEQMGKRHDCSQTKRVAPPPGRKRGVKKGGCRKQCTGRWKGQGRAGRANHKSSRRGKDAKKQTGRGGAIEKKGTNIATHLRKDAPAPRGIRGTACLAK